MTAYEVLDILESRWGHFLALGRPIIGLCHWLLQLTERPRQCLHPPET